MATGEASECSAPAVDALVAHMASRLRRLGTRHWREQVASSGATLADVGFEVVEWCARREAGLVPNRPAHAALVPSRPTYDAAIADQLAVVGRDLALALTLRSPEEAHEVLDCLRGYAKTMKIEPRP